MFGMDRIDHALLLGSTVKWLWMPLLEWLFPLVERLGVRKKRALVLVLSMLLSPIYIGRLDLDCLYLAFNAALIAIGQHHLFKQEKEDDRTQERVSDIGKPTGS
jgi:hypothetical protein